MSSGTYFPPAVKAVPIPKKSGGVRILGIPTIVDRIAQMTVRLSFEPLVEPHFLNDSYGYRPNKSALDAIRVTRGRCWKHDWILEFDIKGLFDNIDHELLLRAVERHAKCRWHILYIKRWLVAPMEMSNGETVARSKGTPQGGVISPILANLFLHYTFDSWMKRNFPDTPWCRYADDGLVHVKTEQQALKEMNAKTRKFGFRNKTNLSIEEISKLYNPVLRGWYNYYGKYYASARGFLWRHFNKTLIAWIMKKFKKVRSKTRAGEILMRIAKQQPKLFIHWEKGIIGSFV